MTSGHRTGPLQELYSSAPFVKGGCKRKVAAGVGEANRTIKTSNYTKENVSIEDSDANFKISLLKLFKR